LNIYIVICEDWKTKKGVIMEVQIFKIVISFVLGFIWALWVSHIPQKKETYIEFARKIDLVSQRLLYAIMLKNGINDITINESDIYDVMKLEEKNLVKIVNSRTDAGGFEIQILCEMQPKKTT
jgi:hypothetical protein